MIINFIVICIVFFIINFVFLQINIDYTSNNDYIFIHYNSFHLRRFLKRKTIYIKKWRKK